MNKWMSLLGSLSLSLASAATHATDVPFIDAAERSQLVFASDPQYPWTDFNDDDRTVSDSDNQKRARELLDEQYRSIADIRKHRSFHHIPVMINGDMTAFGHGWQRDHLYSVLDQHLNGDYYFGLGNHDYQNNVNDCAGDGCARDSIFDLRKRMKDRVDNMDLRTETEGIEFHWKGSLSYTKRIEDVVLVQLNNEPTYQTSFWSNRYTFNITPSLEWLDARLKEAREKNLIIIVNLHKPDDWMGTREELQRFRNMMEKYQVSAVFAGHLHKSAGRYNFADQFADVPVFLSGSASQRSWLIVDVDRNSGHLKVNKVSNNDWKNAELIAEIPLPKRQ
ncbi:metallophosphoesterase family protein [Pseudomonas sp. NPDC090202]|uniref:metallophosphoesterase family protein n=1 Tax=unclassified Pseudomonas TaxID=196821 RepID=UPI0037F77E0B